MSKGKQLESTVLFFFFQQVHITLSYLVELCIEVLHIDSTDAAFDETAAAK